MGRLIPFAIVVLMTTVNLLADPTLATLASFNGANGCSPQAIASGASAAVLTCPARGSTLPAAARFPGQRCRQSR